MNEIPFRSRADPWFESPEVAALPRRDDLFVDAQFAAAVLQTAMHGAKSIRLSWMSLQYDEDRDADVPVQRDEDGLAVMDVTAHSPLGWVYLASTTSGFFMLGLDVITYIAINL